MKMAGTARGNFRLIKRSIGAWPNLFLPLKETILNVDCMVRVNKTY